MVTNRTPPSAPTCSPHGAHRQPTPALAPSPAATPETPSSPTSSAGRASTPAASPPPGASRLSPLAAPFIPAGRTKFLHWRDDCPSQAEDSSPAPSYREVLTGLAPVRASHESSRPAAPPATAPPRRHSPLGFAPRFTAWHPRRTPEPSGAQPGAEVALFSSAHRQPDSRRAA
ncbi:hypothetical protein C2845_PM10G11170 [Panicum miliaceum]|uniref:Uncharacterized protein n=1 Tax=Panicum miliaceum TaxID=4540 RepID=A0A3L6PH49_PANMI|nr:hypothetical protein C2845_PM10G11170 [Panicum miliaceum]